MTGMCPFIIEKVIRNTVLKFYYFYSSLYIEQNISSLRFTMVLEYSNCLTELPSVQHLNKCKGWGTDK